MTRTASFHLKSVGRVAALACPLLMLLCSCASLEPSDKLPPEAAHRKSSDRGAAAPSITATEPPDADAGMRTAGLADAAPASGARDEMSAPVPFDGGSDTTDEDSGEHVGHAMLCADHATSQCSQGVWPDGVIQYVFETDYRERTPIREAMDRWEQATAHVVRFVEAPDATAKVTFRACEHGGAGLGYDACVNGCDVALCSGAIHHTLGRVIGLWPEQRRFDRDHYLRVYGACAVSDWVDRCATPDNASDFGPFDYGSSMFSFTDSSRISRWNGQPICAEEQGCGGRANEEDRPPSALDGSAVIERYQLGTQWSKFRRMVDETAPDRYEPAALTPFTDDALMRKRIASNASPALESWTGETIAVYVRAADDTLMKEWWDATGRHWWPAEPLQKVPGLGDISDPAIASWTPYRNDTVVRRGASIYITSNQLELPWESLGGPAAVAASSPAITTWGENRLDIVVRAQDDRIYHKACSASCAGRSGSWSDWLALAGATVRGKPVIVARGPGLLDVFAHGTDGRIWTIAYAMGSWGAWSALPVSVPLFWDETCPDCSSPAASARTSATLDLFVRGSDNRLWSATWSAADGWAEFVPRGGSLASSPATSSTLRDAGQADVVVIMAEDHGAKEFYRAPWWKSYRPAPEEH